MPLSCIIFWQPKSTVNSQERSDCPNKTRVALVNSEDVQWLDLVDLTYDNFADRLIVQLDGRRPDYFAIILPDDECLPAVLPPLAVPRHERRQVLNYQLEELLPLPAEAYEADFVESDASVLGIATPHKSCIDCIQAMASQGMYVESITPWSTLLLEMLALNQRSINHAILQTSDACHIFDFIHGKLSNWVRIPFDQVNQLMPVYLEERNILTDYSPTPNGTYSITVLNEESSSCEPSLEIDDIFNRSARYYAHIHDSHQSPLIELNRGELNMCPSMMGLRRPLIATCLSIAVLCVASIIGLIYKAGQYQRQTDKNQQQAIKLFNETLDNQLPPTSTAAMRMRLNSQHRLLLGLQGKATDTNLLTAESAYIRFSQLLSNLPRQLRFNLHTIQLDTRQLYLEGTTRSHSDAEKIAQATGNMPNITFASPKTENIKDKGVTFRLTGTIEANQGVSK